jgi:hypothetical protein
MSVQWDNKELVEARGIFGDNGELTENLVKIHVFGNQYMIPHLQNDTLSKLFRHLIYKALSTPASWIVTTAIEQLNAKNPLCRLLIDVSVRYNWDHPESGTPYQNSRFGPWSMEYLLAIAHRATQIIGGLRLKGKHMSDFRLKLCDYHEHKNDDEKKNCEEKDTHE